MTSSLVTGGAGFIGSHLVKALIDQGDQVKVLDDLSSGSEDNLAGFDVELIVGDIRAKDVVERIQNRFVLARCWVDYDMDAFVWYGHR